jgi:hypothetical protein
MKIDRYERQVEQSIERLLDGNLAIKKHASSV